MSLPDKSDVVITHYGTTNFSNDNRLTEILWISAIYFEKGQKIYFYKDTNEIDIIRAYFNFIENQKTKIFLHWDMGRHVFGFPQIAARYQYLTKDDRIVSPINTFDLSEHLKDEYGNNYISSVDGRLNNLARLNSFSGAMPKGETVVNRGIQAANRLELIFSIYQAELQGTLLTNVTTETLYPEYFKSFGYELITKCIDSINKDKIALAPVSAFIHLMRIDGLLTDVSNKSIFFFIKEHFSLNLGTGDKIKTLKSTSKTFTIIYKRIYDELDSN
jgi:hypothetical protein